MTINLSLLILAGVGAFAVGYGVVMDKKSSFEDGTFIYQIVMIAGGVLAVAAAVLMKFVFSVI